MRVALISVHGDPNLQAGGKDAGGMNIYIREVVEKLFYSGFEVVEFQLYVFPLSKYQINKSWK